MSLRAAGLLSVLLLCVGLFQIPGVLSAQNDDKPLTREERLQQHEERVRKIIEERKASREQQAEPEEVREPEQKREEAPASLSSDFGTVIIYNAFKVNEFRRATETESQYNSRISRNGADPQYTLDTVVREGERFLSEVRIQNSNNSEIDRVRMALKYDKRFLRPVKIFDHLIRASADDDPIFQKIDRDGILFYDITFKEPRVSPELVLLQIVWEPILPTEFTSLNFTFAGGETLESVHTGVYSKGSNILGEAGDPFDGVLGGSILVLQPFDPERASQLDITQGKKSELREIYLASVGSQAPAGMQLIGPETPPAWGETFKVDVHLENPGGAVIDALRFFIKFDPEVLEVVDEDTGNWMRRGINVHDGPYRLNYPFDFHKFNEVDNRRGQIKYAMGMSKTLSLPTGTFATIHFKARKAVESTTVELIKLRGATSEVTAINILGYDIMSNDPSLTTPGLQFPVTLVPTKVAKEEGADSPTQKKTDEVSLGVPDYYMDRDLITDVMGET